MFLKIIKEVKKKIRKKMFIVLLVMMIIFALASSLYAQETDPAKVLNTLADALNAGDVDAAITLYAPDAVINIVPPLPGLTRYLYRFEGGTWLIRDPCRDEAQD